MRSFVIFTKFGLYKNIKFNFFNEKDAFTLAIQEQNTSHIGSQEERTRMSIEKIDQFLYKYN